MATIDVKIKTATDEAAEDIYLELTATGKKNVRADLRIFEANMAIENEALIANIAKFVNDRAALPKLEVINQLENQLKNLTADFGTYKKGILQEARKLSYKIQQDIYNDELATGFGFDDNTLYTWEAMFVQTCPDCIELHGTTHTRATWDQLGGPKVYPTICNGHCQCILMPTETMPSKAENRKPILIESERIRKAEKKRGKKYTPEYKSQIIGNMNNKEFRKTMRDLRTIKKVKK